MSVLLAARDATFHRHGEAVFDPVRLELAAGAALVVLGANGSGKTTLLRMAAGILRPTEGRLERRARTAFLGHQAGVKADLSCRENLEYEYRQSDSEESAQDAIARVIARVGLAGLGTRPARTLSAGQLRRLGLARVLIRRAALWILDEPYASLDDAGGALVDTLLDEHLQSGGAALIATHQRLPAVEAGELRLPGS